MDEPQRSAIMVSYQVLGDQAETVSTKMRSDLMSGLDPADLIVAGGRDFAANMTLEQAAFALSVVLMRQAQKAPKKAASPRKKTSVPARRTTTATVREAPDAA